MVEHFCFPAPELSAVRLGISLAAAGDMSTKRSDNALPAAFLAGAAPGKKPAWLLQTHSRIVHEISQTETAAREGDGLVSGNPEIVLAVTVADCVPIYLAGQGCIGMVHSGWKGTGIAAAAVKRMRELQAGPVHALIGPCIGACCYQVDAERAGFFASQYGASTVVTRGGEPFLDLRQANRLLLENLGLASIAMVGGCTVCDPRYGSFRRQGPTAYTHMMAYIYRSEQ